MKAESFVLEIIWEDYSKVCGVFESFDGAIDAVSFILTASRRILYDEVCISTWRGRELIDTKYIKLEGLRCQDILS